MPLPALSRRRLLQATTAGALALATAGSTARPPGTDGAAGAGGAAAGPVEPADPFDALRLRWRVLLTGAGFDAAQQPFAGALRALGERAAAQRRAMAPAAGSLWPDLPLGTVSAHLTSSAGRLYTMALAWVQPGTGLTGDPATAAALTAGLDHLLATAYTTAATPYDNWWDWQIGVPQALLDACVLAFPLLGPERAARVCAAVDRSVPQSLVAAYTGTSTGANRVDLCRVLALRGVLGRDADRLATASAALSPVFPQVLTGDGLYADGSFVQHTRVPYTGTYGEVLLGGLSRLFALLARSPWAVLDPLRANVFDAVEAGYAPFLYNGLVMDAVSGRAVSRGRQRADPLHLQQDDHGRGHALLGHILRLADSGAAGPERSAAWRAAVKGWIVRDGYRPYLSDPAVAVPELARAKALLADRAVAAAPEPGGAKVFAMDRAVVRRPGWAAAVSMCSARTSFYEHGDGENPRGWHAGSGLLAWWAGREDGQYADAFWPTVDPYRLPGTTVSTRRLADGEGEAWGGARPDNTWAGGACDGRYAAVGQAVRGLSSTLSGVKSWFLLDDSILCLGAGLRCADGVPVETVVDNRNLGASGTHELTVDGQVQPVAPGWSRRFPSAGWAALAGFGGWVFPGGARLDALREDRTGRWRDINEGGTDEELTRRYLTLWFDHGTDPSDAGYAYLLLPGASAAATARRAARPTATVLANSASVQAVSDAAAGLTAANFHAPGSVGGITVSAPCSVLVRESGDGLAVSVADPSRASATVLVTVDRPGLRPAESVPGVTVLAAGPAVRLLVELGGTQGATRTTVLRPSGAADVAGAVLLAPVRDAFVRDGRYADERRAAAAVLEVKHAGAAGSGYSRRALFAFDTTGVPGPVRRAVLWVHGAVQDGDGTETVLQAFATAPGPWQEDTVTWNRSPAPGAALGTGRISTAADWVALDVTPALAAGAGPLTLTVGQPVDREGLAVNLDVRRNPEFAPVLQLVTG